MVRFEYVQNKGAFLSLGATMPADARFWLLTVAVAGTLALLIVMILRQKTNPLTTVGLSLLAGGGIGNLIDRIRWGSVIDFANVGIGPLRTGVFNVADMAIMAGVGLMLMDMFRSQNKST
jgi:signal peptidase II